MIASLMMYARPELAGAHDRFWSLIRAGLSTRGIPSPARLSQSAPEFAVWTHPELTLSQTCGMPYRLWLHDKVTLVGTPDYGLERCGPGEYCSAIVVRADDPRLSPDAYRDARFAYNVPYSQSGYAAPLAHVAPLGFWFQDRVQTGAHGKSAAAVASGAADIAAIDAVTWRLLQRHDPIAARLRVLDWTAPTPGLPLITAKGQNGKAIFDAVAEAIEALSVPDREALGLKGICAIPAERYLAQPNPACEDYGTMP